jgi:hypothetical protein
MRPALRVLPDDWRPEDIELAAPNLKLGSTSSSRLTGQPRLTLRVLLALAVLGTVAWVLAVWGIIALWQAIL